MEPESKTQTESIPSTHSASNKATTISYSAMQIKADTLDNLSISEITSIHKHMQINYPNLQLVIYIYIK